MSDPSESRYLPDDAYITPCDCEHCRTGGGLPCITETLAEFTPFGE